MLVTFNSKGEYQLHMALGIVIVALHVHDSQRPFGHRHVNPTNAVLHRYEMGSLVVLLGMLWCGGFFSLNLCRTQNGWCEFMVVVVLVGNFLLVGVLLAMFCKEWCIRKHVGEKVIELIEKRRSSARRRVDSVGETQKKEGSKGASESGSESGEVKERSTAQHFDNPMLLSGTSAKHATKAPLNNSRTQRQRKLSSVMKARRSHERVAKKVEELGDVDSVEMKVPARNHQDELGIVVVSVDS